MLNFVDISEGAGTEHTNTRIPHVQYIRIRLNEITTIASAVEQHVGYGTMNTVIDSISVVKSPLGVENSPERNVLYHGFIVFSVGQHYWSVEKTNEGVTIQRALLFDEVAHNKLEVSRSIRKRRLDPIEVVQSDRAQVTVGELFQFVVALMARKYHLTHSNCKHFSSQVFNFAAEKQKYFPSLGI